MLSMTNVKAFETSVVATSGQTLYFNYVKDLTDNQWVAILVHPANVNYSGSWGSYEMPVGNLVIPDSIYRAVGGGSNVPVRGIQSYAFMNCSGLTSVVIPNTVKAIGESAFYMCSGLTSVTMPSTLSTITPESGASVYSFVPNAIASFTFSGCFQLSGNIVIPEGVTTIADHAFTSTNISSITWPTALTTIGGLAFSSCNNLGTVTIPSSVTTIEGGAFYNCYKVLSINVPVTVEFTDYSYGGMDYPATQTFNLVKNINYTGSLIDTNNTYGVGAWGARTLNGYIENGYVYSNQNKTKLTACNYEQTSVTLPASVDTIGFGAFLWHLDLTQVTMPEGVLEIGSNAFISCSALSQIDIPSTVAKIDAYAFSYCSGLGEITLPETLTNLGTGVFSECELDTLRMLGSVPPTDDYQYVGEISMTTGDTIWYTDNSLVDIPIVVPCHAGSAYRHAAGWSLCNNIIDPCGDDMEYFTVTASSADTTMGSATVNGCFSVTVEDGTTVTIVATANEGYHFLNWNDGDTLSNRTVTVTSDTTFTAIFAADSVAPIDTLFSLVLNVNDTAMGTVSGSGSYHRGDTVTISAIANEGYSFVNWSDGDTLATRTLVITSDLSLTAVFTRDSTESIADVELDNIKLYTDGMTITIQGALVGETVLLYSVDGRCMDKGLGNGGNLRFEAPASGLYIVRVGNRSVHRVVVVR